ncbi:uncharacterized protein [Montipora capricornis]|uniref:uncharacterized protein n=1 Tax=Montipora capricornis TaxID=246305 RepID=UPI0035F1D496
MAQSACPHRQYMDDPAIKWREGKPDFTKINKAYLEGRTRNHKEGSLEKIVEDLVKTWEMEASHKIRLEDWQAIDRDSFTLRANHQRTFTARETIEVGSYNALMQNQPLYNSNKHTFESSHELFRSAFSEGFAWELLEVFSGPPRVAFSWRHWANWTGPYKDKAPTGERLEMYGMAVAEVDEKLKIKSIECYFDPNQILMKLEGKEN